MTVRKFSPMTANLLARKGDACPSMPSGPKTVNGWARDNLLAPLSIDHPDPAEPPTSITALAVPEHEDAARIRRIMVCVTPGELERLGIAAIKKGKTRHEVVQEALENYFEKLARELPGHCSCMAGGGCCG